MASVEAPSPCEEISDTCLSAPRIGDPVIDFALPIEIDIKPDSSANAINPSANGVVPVAILGSDVLDVADVDVATLAFGPNRAVPSHGERGRAEDVNGDGFVDLVLHFSTEDSGIAEDDTEACLTGELLDGRLVGGCDAIQTVPARGRGNETIGGLQERPCAP